MEAFIAWFSSIAPFIGEYRYPLLTVITILEGTFTTIAVSIAAAATDLFQPGWTYLACVVGTTLGGFFWYAVGYWGGAWPLEKFMHSTPVRRALLDRIRHHSDRAAGMLVLLTKLMYAATVPTIIIVGSLRYNIKRFAWYYFSGSVIWTTVLFWAGYAIGEPIALYLASLHFTGVVLVVALLGALIVWGLRSASNMIIRRVQSAIPEDVES